MADKAPEYLSAEELRNRLYHSLRNRGLVNTIKSQLRTSLITELQQSVQGPLTLHDLEPQESDPLILRAANSLVADHLRRAKYEYSLGVFLPESGLAQDKIFQSEDLMRLLHISPHSRLYKQLWMNADTQTDKGLLWQVLTEIAALHSHASQDSGTQVDLMRAGPITSLDAKLHSLEELYSSRRDDLNRSGHSAVEERLLNYQRQLEDRYNSQLKLELARLKDSEVAQMQLEEKENSRKELEQTKRELQRTYQEKYDRLVERERNSIERLQKEQELQEKEVYSQRQMLLSEIESMRQREAEVKREAEVNKREKQLTEDRNKAKEDELRHREMELRNKEIQFDQRLQNEMAQFKLDQQAKFIDRVQHVEVREAKVKEGERIVAEEKSQLQTVKDDLRDKTHRVNELETALQEARHLEVTATRHNEFINAKLRDMADYQTIKEQNVSHRGELETLRTRLSELLTMNERERGRQEELLRELRRPSPETLMMQRDLERARENLRQEQVVFQQQKQLLESRLKDEVDRNRDLVQRLEEQMLQMKEMNREVVDLRKQLAMTQTVLNNEVYRKPKDDAGDRSRSPLQTSHHSVGEVAQNSLRAVSATLDPRGSRGPVTFGADRDVYNDLDSDFGRLSWQCNKSELSDDHSSAVSADIVAETRYRLRGLEKEAQNLEQAYHDFHCHMTNVNALPFDAPPAPLPAASVLHLGNSSHHVQAQRTGASPPPSPIPHDRPMSSTPYKSRPDPSVHDDSFAELSGGRLQDVRTAPPQFDLSNVSDEGEGKQPLETKHVKSRPITVDDLEARPGSPSMLVVAESESAGTPQQSKDQPKPAKLEPLVPSHPAPEKVSSSAPSLSLDAAWKQPSVSLDDAWKKPVISLDKDFASDREAEGKKEEQRKEEEKKQEEERRRKEEEERRMEEERRRRRNEEEERKRKEEEEEKRREEERKKEEEEKAEKEMGGIDPVMLQYMARVQAMKEQEKQAPKETTKATAVKDHSPSQSEDVSMVDDVKSDHDFDDDIW